jgi:uncharacterized protein YegL
MDTNYTHITMVIDRSGSMGSCWNDVVGGYAEIVKENKEEAGKCTFTVAAFDTDYELIEDFIDIKKVDEKLTIRPRGGTALLDAIGKTIVSVGEKLAKMKEAKRPGKVIVMVQTDGEENSSKEFTKDAIKKLIDEHQAKYSWQFMFLGASLSSVNEARNWGFKASNSSVYDTNNSLDTFTLLSAKTKGMRSASMETYASVAAFSDADKKILNESK